MLNTKCRWGTASTTCPQSHSPDAATRFWWQLGQKCRRLHEKASRYS